MPTPPQTIAKTSVALWDTETNGLLDEASTIHCVTADISGAVFSCADQPGYQPISVALRALEEADIRVAHNGDDFDERITRRIYPWWNPKGRSLDTLLMSRLAFPQIAKQGPNTHKVEPQLKTRHSLKAWGQRLGEHKGDYKGGWEAWSPEMHSYMNQDRKTLKRLFKYLMSLKLDPRSVQLEHDFARIIRRQEAWGFTFDHDKALTLAADIQQRSAVLEAELVETYGEWWEPGKTTSVKGTRSVKMLGHPNVTRRRYSPSSGKELKPYVGPPEIHYEEGAQYTPIKRVLFSPSSRDHVRKMLYVRHGWKPTKFTEKGAPQVDDDVLRALPYPEAQQLADYYTLLKVGGYVSAGKKAWLLTAKKEPDAWRQHGRVNTIGTYTFRCSHSDPNLGQVPTRSPEFGHKCRELFIARPGFVLVGFDGSGLQLRLLAHYLAKWDGGEFARVVTEADPHAWLQNLIGLDLMGEGPEGRDKGKRINYALPFGAGDRRLGTIVSPNATDREKVRIGKLVKERMAERFSAVDELRGVLRGYVEERGYIPGLDGRKAPCHKPHTALATLLQMAEAVVMREALVWLDRKLQEEGLRPGVDAAGICYPELADYEFAANVHDEAQADVREAAFPVYQKYALQCVTHAGEHFKLKCPLKSDVKKGLTWVDTH